ncbi:hypothetical protein PMAYCL1PPCAC_18233, partial [Pristionchus mayeri]
RTKEDSCHLCQYHRCNSGKKLIVRGEYMKKTRIVNGDGETTTHGSHIEKEMPPFPFDETLPLPIEIAFPHRIISSSEMARVNGSLISHSKDSYLPLPIPVDESAPAKIEKGRE